MAGKSLKETDRKVSELRNMIVAKSNMLIQKSRHSLNLQEQKIILYLISKIKFEDTKLYSYNFEIREFCKIAGIDYDNGKNYQNLKDTIKKLADKSIWVTLENGIETIVRWIDKPYLDEGGGVIKIKMDEMMMPYLLQLKEQYTQYNLYYTLAMKSQYSIRLYELLKSYQNLGEQAFTIDELKKRMGAETYKEFSHFRQRALEPALKEIASFTELNIQYRFEKLGRKYNKVLFRILQKENPTKTITNVQHELGEMTPWERLEYNRNSYTNNA